jgi:hypothetical protein
MRRLRAHRARQQVGRVGFDHQPVRGNVLHQLAQVQAAAFVAQPAGDAHVPVLVQVIEQFLARAGEAVHDRGAELAVEVAHRRHEVGVRIALVQEHGLARVRGDLQLHLEGAPLRRARREIAEVIQAAFADRDDLGHCLQRAHLRVALGRVLGRVVRMHAGGREQFAGMRTRQLGGHRRMRAAGTGDDHAGHAGVAGALHHRVAVVVEAVVGEVGADVDELHGRSLAPRPVSFRA